MDFNEEDMQSSYDYFFEKYAPTVYEVTDESRELLKDVDPKLVWTAHSTCEHEYISPGFLEFSPDSCCWQEYEWYVSKTPWESDDSKNWVLTSYDFPCTECNPEGLDDVDGKENCEICEGNGTYRYYAD